MASLKRLPKKAVARAEGERTNGRARARWRGGPSPDRTGPSAGPSTPPVTRPTKPPRGVAPAARAVQTTPRRVTKRRQSDQSAPGGCTGPAGATGTSNHAHPVPHAPHVTDPKLLRPEQGQAARATHPPVGIIAARTDSPISGTSGRGATQEGLSKARRGASGWTCHCQ